MSTTESSQQVQMIGPDTTSTKATLPKKIDSEAMSQFTNALGMWISTNETALAFDSNNKAPSVMERYSRRLALRDEFDTLFYSKLKRLFVNSFEDCEQCRSYCPSTLAYIYSQYNSALRNIGIDCPSNAAQQEAMCMEILCPASFGFYGCGIWRIKKREREIVTYTALATLLLGLLCAASFFLLRSSGSRQGAITQEDF